MRYGLNVLEELVVRDGPALVGFFVYIILDFFWQGVMLDLSFAGVSNCILGMCELNPAKFGAPFGNEDGHVFGLQRCWGKACTVALFLHVLGIALLGDEMLLRFSTP